MPEHAGTVALITGGSSGIGRAVAMRLARSGATAIVNSANSDEVAATVAEIRAAGGKASGLIADVTETSSIQRRVEELAAEFGRLDVLVTAAGIQRYGTVTETSDDLWHEVMDVNLTGVFRVVREAMPLLRASGRGSVVVISSVQGLATQDRVVAYAASKGALNAFVRAVAVDEARHGMRINSVLPGSVDTPMLRSSAAMLAGDTEPVEAVLARWGSTHPLGRVATVQEVAEVVSFLASPAASFVTGTELRVDGGLLARLPVVLTARDS